MEKDYYLKKLVEQDQTFYGKFMSGKDEGYNVTSKTKLPNKNNEFLSEILLKGDDVSESEYNEAIKDIN